jgi:hypothetical protein
MTQVNGFAERSGKIRKDTFRHSKRTSCPAGTISCLAGSTSCRSESGSCLSRRSIRHPSPPPPPTTTTKRQAHSKSRTMILHSLSQEEKMISHEILRSRSKPVHSVRSGSCEAPRVGSRRRWEITKCSGTIVAIRTSHLVSVSLFQRTLTIALSAPPQGGQKEYIISHTHQPVTMMVIVIN